MCGNIDVDLNEKRRVERFLEPPQGFYFDFLGGRCTSLPCFTLVEDLLLILISSLKSSLIMYFLEPLFG